MLVRRRKGLRGEARVIWFESKREVQLGRTPAQQPGRRQVWADERAGQRRAVPLRQCEQGLVWYRGMLPTLLGASSRKGAVKGLQRIAPGIPPVRYEAVEDTNSGRSPRGSVLLESPGDTGDVGEGRPLCQKAPEFQVRVHAVGHAPKEF